MTDNHDHHPTEEQATADAGFFALAAEIDESPGSADIVDRAAPRWVWEIVDTLLTMEIACADDATTIDLLIQQTLAMTAIVAVNQEDREIARYTAAEAARLAVAGDPA